MKLPKSARIHHRSLQEKLFSRGSKLHEYPLKLMWNSLTQEELQENFRDRVPDLIGPVQVLVSVPKKKRRKAVDRVLMRRRIREAFRLNRGPLLEALGELGTVRTLSVGIVYMKEANASYSTVEEKMVKLLARLAGKVRDKYLGKEENAEEKEDKTNEETALETSDSAD